MKLLLTSLFTCLVWGSLCAQPAHGTFGSIARVKNAAVAFYVGDEQEPAAVMRVKRIHREYQRKGFFRIGVLPMVAFEGVILEIQHPDSVTNSLAQCHQWLSSSAGGRLELRDVQLVVLGGSTNRLTCGYARPAADGSWELFQGVTFVSATKRIEAARAVLQVSGAQAGRLVMETSPPWSCHVCSDLVEPKKQTHEN